jgi:signal transduction histidine kinase
VVLNLLSNAVKFTPPGGRVEANVGMSAAGEAVITIADTGIGMTAAEIAVAQQPFGRAETALVRKYEGTGLGLSLVRRLVELHGGRVEIESSKGAGTTVRVVLPAASGTCAPPQPEAA